jgi:predicted permease
VLAMVGGALGIATAAVAMRWLIAALPPSVPRTSEIGMSGATVAFTVGLTILTGLGFGLLPALRATAGTSAVGNGGSVRATASASHQRLSSMLIVGEVGLAVLLVIGAELLVRSFRDLQRLDPGFRPDHVVTARVTPPPASYDAPGRVNVLYGTLLARLGALPGVEAVAAVNLLPMAAPVYGAAMRIEGQYENIKQGLPTEDHAQIVTPDYFTAMRIPLLRGREFSEADAAAAQPVVVISQSMARRFWPNEDAVGKRIGYPWDSPWMTVVGVVADVRSDSLRDTSRVAVYIPFLQRVGKVSEYTVVVRTRDEPTALMSAVQSSVSAIDRGVPVSQLRTMNDVIAQSLDRPRFVMGLVSAFALVALILGAVGIYGVMSYIVRQRTQEIGIRMAFGATPAAVQSMVVGRAIALAVAGAAIGAGAAILSMRPLRGLLYGISPSDPVTYASVAIGFVIVAMLAALAPARRATRVNPVTAIRGS